MVLSKDFGWRPIASFTVIPGELRGMIRCLRGRRGGDWETGGQGDRSDETENRRVCPCGFPSSLPVKGEKNRETENGYERNLELNFRNFNMRKTLLFLLSIAALASCQTTTKKNTEKIVFASILPLQYFTDQITGNLYVSEVMVPPGVGPETYNPTPRQMAAMAKAGAFFANGFLGFEEAYLDKFKSNNPNLIFVNTSVGVELIQATGHDDGDQVHEKGVDPHTWSSPEGARIIARNIYNGMVKIDPANQSKYQTNLDRLLTRIDSVDLVVKEILTNIPSRKFMVFHPALGYFAREYGLEQLSIEFEGKIPTPRHIQDIVLQAKAQNIKYIMIQREFDVENAEIIANETGSKVIQIDPLAYDWPGQMISLARKMAAAK
jgi:zinc transport system substrate-binding protein